MSRSALFGMGIRILRGHQICEPSRIQLLPPTACLTSLQSLFLRRQSSSAIAREYDDSGIEDEPTLTALQLGRLADLQQRVSAENSKFGKQRIIAEYPDLRRILEYVYDPTLRTHLTYTSYKNYVKSLPHGPPWIDPPEDIFELFDKLSRRSITGNIAKNIVHSFLAENEIIHDPSLMDVFGRLLDRNLVAGFGANTLKLVEWPQHGEPPNDKERIQPTTSCNSNTLSLAAPKPTKPGESSSALGSSFVNTTPIHPKASYLDKFEVALGKSLEPPFDSLFKGGSQWYASRKLDGVRCITFLDLLIPFNSASSTDPLEVLSIHFVSRTGKPFTSLAKLQEQLLHLSHLPGLRKWLDVDPTIVEEQPEGVVKRLILDGEVCVMKRKTEEELITSQARDDGSVADTMWIANDPFVEDFSSTVSAMRRSDTIQHLNYFLFDVLSFAELDNKTSIQQPGLGKRFGERIEDIRHLGAWLNGKLDEVGVHEKMVKDLKQIKVVGVKDVEGMVERAAREGWEGIILRKDEGYRGKRSNDIRKFKKWLDAEYQVLALDTSSMRLSINGTFGEHEALANVWIEHEGHRVSVGSGFTADQRIKYAKNPEQIVGKWITVEYFSESDSMERSQKGNKGKSLRFPRIKMVWEEGKRGM
ncbi:uncharacterized protein IL334_006355 [Kwoniella shivajii]|uniref:ATP-dependent DNA ligase family profile domain-containing protein n=1 Tax=Kwoniella shivajii TaxID=564305 RepID=A0ABZ1D5Q6_9TREE|nr:hypothetical protein IL334_006355 [Kwoniella shivajii]